MIVTGRTLEKRFKGRFPSTVGFYKFLNDKSQLLEDDTKRIRFPTHPEVRRYLAEKLMATGRPRSVQGVFMGWPGLEEDGDYYTPYLDRILHDEEYRREEIMRLLPEDMIRLEVENLYRLYRWSAGHTGWIKDRKALERYMR